MTRAAIPLIVALAPLAAIVLDPYLGKAAPWTVLGGSAALCLVDRRLIQTSSSVRYPLWSALVFPVHLLRRSREDGRRPPFAFVWILAMLVHSML